MLLLQAALTHVAKPVDVARHPEWLHLIWQMMSGMACLQCDAYMKSRYQSIWRYIRLALLTLLCAPSVSDRQADVQCRL